MPEQPTQENRDSGSEHGVYLGPAEVDVIAEILDTVAPFLDSEGLGGAAEDARMYADELLVRGDSAVDDNAVIHHGLAQEFVRKHDASNADGQFKMVVEEVGELSEALNTDMDDEAVGEELADVYITIRVLAEMLDINLDSHYVSKMEYNLQKSGSREGAKIADDVEGVE